MKNSNEKYVKDLVLASIDHMDSEKLLKILSNEIEEIKNSCDYKNNKKHTNSRVCCNDLFEVGEVDVIDEILDIHDPVENIKNILNTVKSTQDTLKPINNIDDKLETLHEAIKTLKLDIIFDSGHINTINDLNTRFSKLEGSMEDFLNKFNSLPQYNHHQYLEEVNKLKKRYAEQLYLKEKEFKQIYLEEKLQYQQKLMSEAKIKIDEKIAAVKRSLTINLKDDSDVDIQTKIKEEFKHNIFNSRLNSPVQDVVGLLRKSVNTVVDIENIEDREKNIYQLALSSIHFQSSSYKIDFNTVFDTFSANIDKVKNELNEKDNLDINKIFLISEKIISRFSKVQQINTTRWSVDEILPSVSKYLEREVSLDLMLCCLKLMGYDYRKISGKYYANYSKSSLSFLGIESNLPTNLERLLEEEEELEKNLF